MADMQFAGFSATYLVASGVAWLVVLAGFVIVARVQPWKSPRRFVRLATRPFLAAWSLLAVALLCEAAFALGYDTTDAFSVTLANQRWLNRHVRMNQLDFRDAKEFVSPRQPGRRRLVLLGDSFAFGYGVADPANRFGDILEERLARQSPPCELYNVAQPGKSTAQEVSLLKALLARGMEIDQVLLAYCLNDLDDLLPQTKEVLSSIALSKPQSFIIRDFYLPNYLYYRLQFERREFRDYFYWVRDGYEGETWREQQSRFDELRAICAEKNIELLVVVFPFLHNLGPSYPFEDAHGALAKYWHANGTPYLDLLETMRKHRDETLTVNRFDAHPNERTHALAADAIWDNLLKPGSNAAP